MRLPATVTIRSRDLPPGARGLEGMTFKVRYSMPLRFRIWLALVLWRAGVWLAGGTSDVGRRTSDDE